MNPLNPYESPDEVDEPLDGRPSNPQWTKSAAFAVMSLAAAIVFLIYHSWLLGVGLIASAAWNGWVAVQQHRGWL